MPKPIPSLFIGLDPGSVSGAIAILGPSGQPWWQPLAKATDQEIFLFLRNRTLGIRCLAVLENVHSMPKQGIASAFKFGESVGKLKMALAGVGIPYQLVTPQTWQRAMGCLSKGDKKVTRAAAQRIFPDPGFRVTDNNADALLLAEYARRLHHPVKP